MEINANRIAEVVKTLVLNGHKTDLDSQIKCIESLSENLMMNPTLLSVVESLKELKAIKKK